MKLALAFVTVAILGVARTSLALEPGTSVGVGGHGMVTTTTGGHGIGSAGLGSSGVTAATSGGRGLASLGSGGFNRSTTDGYNNTGIPFKVMGGKGRTTMETVPGRSPTYIITISGRRDTALMGAVGP